jgi:hypothetical protein
MNHAPTLSAGQRRAMEDIFHGRHQIRSTLDLLADDEGRRSVEHVIPHIVDGWRTIVQQDEADGIEREARGILQLGAAGQPLIDRMMRHADRPLDPLGATHLLRAVAAVADQQHVREHLPRLLTMPWVSDARTDQTTRAYLRHECGQVGLSTGSALRHRFGDDPALRQHLETVTPQEDHQQIVHQRLLLQLGSTAGPVMDLAQRLAVSGNAEPSGSLYADTFFEHPVVLLSWMERQPPAFLRSDERFTAVITQWAVGGTDHLGEPLPQDIREGACTLLGRVAASTIP